MALTLVYTGEHYVVDVVGGWLTAVIAVAAATALRPADTGPGAAAILQHPSSAPVLRRTQR